MKLPKETRAALQIVRGIVDTDPQGEVCEASADCVDSDPEAERPMSTTAAELGLVAEEIAGALLQLVAVPEPEHGWCIACGDRPALVRDDLCAECLRTADEILGRPEAGHA